MASLPRRPADVRRPAEVRRPVDEMDSVRSEDRGSAVPRLQLPVNAVQSSNASSSITSRAPPPPLPPKPAFARSTVLPPSPSPPALPPKPLPLKAERLSEAAKRLVPPSPPPDLTLGGSAVPGPPPARPLPPVPPQTSSPADDGSWPLAGGDDRSGLEPPAPPEPTIISDGDVIRSAADISTPGAASGMPAASAGADGADAATGTVQPSSAGLPLSIAPPPFPAPAAPLMPLLLHDAAVPPALLLSREAADDATVAATLLGQARARSDPSRWPSRPPSRPAPIDRRLYQATLTTSEMGRRGVTAVWEVLRELLTNTELKEYDCDRALRTVASHVVKASLQSVDEGVVLLTEIMRRMRDTEHIERDGTRFTLLLHIAAHVSAIPRSSWSFVEEVMRCSFSNIVEEMRHKQEDDVIWERALRCFMVLLEVSEAPPSEDFSSTCISLLAMHAGPLRHTDIDHELIVEGLVPRLRKDEDVSQNPPLNRRELDGMGGFETICTLFAETASPSARRALFDVMLDVAMLRATEHLPSDEDGGGSRHADALRAFLSTHDASTLFAHAFRIGPHPTFVPDLLRLVLFAPLSLPYAPTPSATTNSPSSPPEQSPTDPAITPKPPQPDSHTVTPAAATNLAAAAAKHATAARATLRLLRRPLVLRTLQHLSKTAGHHAAERARAETMRHAREWRILRDAEQAVATLRFRRILGGDAQAASAALDDVLAALAGGAMEILATVSCSLRTVMAFTDLVLSLLAVRPPYQAAPPPSDEVDAAPRALLRGKLVVPRFLLDRTDSAIFVHLLQASRQKNPTPRVSETRQCLVELIGAVRERDKVTELLREFVHDDDAAVAYRSAEISGRGADGGSLTASSPARDPTEVEQVQAV